MISRYWPACCVMVAMLIATAWASNLVRSQITSRNRLQFGLKFESLRSSLGLELHHQRDLLDSVRGLFSASRSVEKEEWETFVRGALAGSNDELLEGICYVEPVRPEGAEEFAAAVHGDDRHGSRTGVSATHTDGIMPRYLDPRDPEGRWASYDFGSCPEARGAAERARDTGFFTATGIHELPGFSSTRRGVVVFMPIYRNGQPTRTVGDRRAALMGWAVSVIKVENLIGKFSDVYNLVGMELFEGILPSPGRRLAGANPTKSEFEAALKSEYALSTSLNFAGSIWTLVAWPSAVFFPPSQRTIPVLVILIGVLFGALGAGVTILLMTTRAHAIDSAQRAVESLGRNEILMTAVIENAADGFMILDRDYRVISANTGAHDLLLGSCVDLRDRHIDEIVSGDGGRALKEDCRRALSDGSRVVREIPIPGPADVWLEFRIARGGEGTIVYFRDVTDRRRTLDLLRESEERFRLALHHSPIIVFTQDRELRYTWVYNASPAFPEKTILGKTDAEILPAEYAAPLMAINRQALDTEQEVRAEVVVPAGPGGAERTYDLRTVPRRDERGGVIGVTCVAADVTSRKNVEAALRESEAKYRHLFEGSADGIFVMTDTFRDCNERVCEMWGCSREDVIGHTPADFSPPLQPNGRPSAEAARDLIAAALAGTPRFFRWTHRRKDGGLIDTEISLKAVLLGGAQVLLATMRDITEQVRREEELRRRAAESSDLADVLTKVIAATTISEISRLIAEHAQLVTTSEVAFAGYIDSLAGHLVVPSMNLTTPLGKRITTGEATLRSFRGSWEKSLMERVPELSNTPMEELGNLDGQAGNIPIRRFLTIPAMIGGELVGLLAVANARRDYTEADLSRVKLLASIFAQAVRRLPDETAGRTEPKAA